MAHDTSQVGETAWSFLNYLGTEQHMRFRTSWHSKHGLPGLLDIVDDWLVNADGIEECPSFETLLIAMTFIVDGWIEHVDARKRSPNSWDLTLWPTPEYVGQWQAGEEQLNPEAPGVPVPLCNHDHLSDLLISEAGGAPETSPDYQDSEVWDHPVYRRDHFEQVQQQHRLRAAEATK